MVPAMFVQHMVASSQTSTVTERAELEGVPQTRLLSEMRSGETAVILGVTAEPRLAKRLADMGFVGGSRVDMIRTGRPCLVRVNGTRVGLGRGYQNLVLVDAP